MNLNKKINQDKIETTHVVTGAPVSACVILFNNGDNLEDQRALALAFLKDRDTLIE